MFTITNFGTLRLFVNRSKAHSMHGVFETLFLFIILRLCRFNESFHFKVTFKVTYWTIFTRTEHIQDFNNWKRINIHIRHKIDIEYGLSSYYFITQCVISYTHHCKTSVTSSASSTFRLQNDGVITTLRLRVNKMLTTKASPSFNHLKHKMPANTSLRATR